MTNEFSKMITNYLLPPKVETYLITDTNVVAENLFTVNQQTGQKEHIHPEHYKFQWATEPNNELLSIHNSLLSQTNDGRKSVIAIFEDKNIKTFLNVDETFKPTLYLKDN